MPWLTPSNDDAPIVCRRIFIPHQFLPMVDGALTLLTLIYQWEEFGDLTPQQCADRMLVMYNDYLQSECLVSIGVIVPYITSSVPNGALACDGTVYNRVDYPLLYAALDPAFILSPDTFFVPDLRGRTIIGAGTGGGLSTYTVNQSGGAEAITLDVSEMPSHSHGNTSHAHSESIAIPTVEDISPGVPVPGTIPGTGLTGFTTIDIHNTGGDGSHENRQPFLALNYCIYWM